MDHSVEEMIQWLKPVSQLDELEDTVHDFERCSVAATLSAYLILGGNFEACVSRFDVEPDLTRENVQRLQDAIYIHANRDGEPGIFGSCIPEYSDAGALTGWRWHPDDEYKHVVNALGLNVDRIYSGSDSEPDDKRAAVQRALNSDEQVVFVVGVDEDMDTESFQPMVELGNHYIAVVKVGDQFYALDSYRTEGRSTLVEMNLEQVEDNLMYTPNAIFALTLQ
ncbi:MAG: hypothetical protein AAF456_17435 [Planctomycetota bacterium]